MRSRTAPADPTRAVLVRLPLTLVAGMLVWLLLRPALDVAVPALAEVLIRSFEVPRVTRLVPSGHWLEVRRADFRAGSKIPTLPLTEIHFNTIVLLALFLALPRPFSRRQLERLLIGASALYLTQAVNLAFDVKSLYATRLGEWSLATYSPLARNVFGFAQYFTDLPGRFSAPFVIWLALNWELVSGLLARSVAAAAERPTARAGKKRPGPTSPPSRSGGGSEG